MPQLPTVSAKFVADVEGMIAQLKRAENATHSTAGSIDREVDELAKKLQRKFSLADVGKDLLRGLGIGSGFELASKAAEAIADHFKEAAEAAKQIEESSAESLKLIQQTIAAKNTDQQNLDRVNAELARLEKERQRLMNPPTERVKITNPFTGFTSDQFVAGEPDLVGAEKIKQQMQELGKEAEDLKAKIKATYLSLTGELDPRDLKGRYDEIGKGVDRYLKDSLQPQIKAEHDNIEAKGKAAAAVEELAQKYREIADPDLKFKKQLEEINRVLADQPEIAARAREAVNAAMAEDKNARINKDLENFFGPLDQWARILSKADQTSIEIERVVGRAADGMADAWVNALHGVEGAWSKLGDTIISEIERVVAEILFVKPFINSLGGVADSFGFSTLAKAFSTYGSPHARGGGVEPGYTYQVNENGQEFFRPNVGGTIIPVGASAAMRGGGGGDVYQIDARGADQAAFARLESIIRQLNGSIERRSIAAVAAAKRRGGRDAAALA